jgi:hypothetical protein
VNDRALAVYVLHSKPDQFAFRTQHTRHTMMGVLRVRDRVGWETALQRANEEEPQPGHLSRHGSHSQLAFVQRTGLPLADMLRTEPIWRLAEVACEPLDGADVRACSRFSRSPLPSSTRSVRRASGSVLVGMSDM